MLVRDLREGLGHLAALLTAWQGNKAATTDIARLNELLSAHDELSVGEFCKRVEAALGTAPYARPPKSPKYAPANGAVVAHYLTSLRDSRADAAKFDEILEQMNRDRKVRKQEWAAIADEYVGVRLGAKGKAAALAAIRHKRNQIASMSSRLERIGEIF